MGSSRTRARTHVPCISRLILNHCTTREVLVIFLLIFLFLDASSYVLTSGISRQLHCFYHFIKKNQINFSWFISLPIMPCSKEPHWGVVGVCLFVSFCFLNKEAVLSLRRIILKFYNIFLLTHVFQERNGTILIWRFIMINCWFTKKVEKPSLKLYCRYWLQVLANKMAGCFKNTDLSHIHCQ